MEIKNNSQIEINSINVFFADFTNIENSARMGVFYYEVFLIDDVSSKSGYLISDDGLMFDELSRYLNKDNFILSRDFSNLPDVCTIISNYGLSVNEVDGGSPELYILLYKDEYQYNLAYYIYRICEAMKEILNLINVLK